MARAFSAGGSIAPSDITYDDEVLDTYGAFNTGTGVFVAPRSGTYMFLFNADVYESDKCSVYVYINGIPEQYFSSMQEDGDKNDRQINAFWYLTLSSGDEVKMFNNGAGCVYVSDLQQLYFMGMSVA